MSKALPNAYICTDGQDPYWDKEENMSLSTTQVVLLRLDTVEGTIMAQVEVTMDDQGKVQVFSNDKWIPIEAKVYQFKPNMELSNE